MHNSTFEHLALFGEGEFDITDNLHLTGGFRWFQESIEAHANFSIEFLGIFDLPLDTKFKEDDVLFKGALAYDMTGNATVYFSYAEGFRPGGFNFRVIVPTIPLTYDSDSNTSLEIGAKSSWLDGLLTANAAVYRTKWKDAQLADFSEPITQGAANFTFNAGEVRILGAELELFATPTDGLDLGAGLGWNDTKLENDVFSQVSGTLLATAGEKVPFSPEITFNVFGSYRWPLWNSALHGFGRVDYAFVDEQRTDFGISATTATIAEYDILDIRAGVEGESWSLTVFATNVADERATLNFFDPVNVGLSRNQPRTVGITLRGNL